MQSIVAQLDKKFREAISRSLGMEADPLITASQNEKLGDYQSNAAMGLVKVVSQKTGQKPNPRQIAQQIMDKLDPGAMVAELSVAGPGFINVRLNPEWIARTLGSMDARLGVERVSEPQHVLVDYSGPNIAKSLHIGHLRSTVIGDVISRVLEFQGHQVIRQNHVGDWGTQFGMLLANMPASGSEQIEDLDAFYKAAKARFDENPIFATEARETVVRLQRGDEKELTLWNRIRQTSRDHFQPIYDRLGIKLNQADERGESFYNPFLADVVKELREKGVATESDGAIVVFVEGFEAPLIIQKRDGGFGYGTTDLAALRYRIQTLGAKRIVYVTDARQMQHFKQVFAAAQKAGWTEGVQLEHVTFGNILGKDGKPFKARSGEAVRMRDVLDEAYERALTIVREKNPELDEARQKQVAAAVSIGGVKYFDVNRDRMGDYVFDWELMLSPDGNTGPYLQYAYARTRSILRKSGTDQYGPLQLEAPAELSLAKHILRLGEIVELVARDLRPHHLCNYLYELASRLGTFYLACNVLKSEEPTRSSRLALCDLTARTMALGLDLLGIVHLEEM